MVAWGVLAFGLELLAARLPFPGLVAAHAALALLTWQLWRAAGRPELAARRAGFLALAVPFTGALAAAALRSRAPRHVAEPIEPAGVACLTPADLSPPPRPFRGLWELEPILRHGDLDARLGAVRALKALEGSDGVRVLRSMLTDEDHQVVLLASLALAELEAEFETAIREAREADDPALASHLRRYAASGLAPEVTLPALWREVAAIATRPEDLAAARLALGDLEGVLAVAGEAAALARLEALFKLGAYGRLEAEARTVVAPAGSAPALVAAYWSDPDD